MCGEEMLDVPDEREKQKLVENQHRSAEHNSKNNSHVLWKSELKSISLPLLNFSVYLS